ncbi:MAG: hypothetical protein ACREDR_40175, partial [Blastocatellia bacterium]
MKTKIQHMEKEEEMISNRSRSLPYWRARIYGGVCVSLAGLLWVSIGLTDTSVRKAPPLGSPQVNAKRVGAVASPGFQPSTIRASGETTRPAGAIGWPLGERLTGPGGNIGKTVGLSSKVPSITSVSSAVESRPVPGGKPVKPMMTGSTIMVTTTLQKIGGTGTGG